VSARVPWPSRGGGRARTLGHGEAFALLAALSFLAARLLPLLELPYRCPFRSLTGLPCATCGMTHAFVHLAHGELLAAAAASPLGAALAAGAWAFALADGARLALGAPWPSPRPRAARAAVAVASLALLANWGYLLATRHAR
jgi:hypothetical protein